MKPLETTIEEVLRNAIHSEVETRVYYQRMAERAGSPEVRKRMLSLADGELVHRAKLERRYHEMIGVDPPDPPPANVDIPPEIRPSYQYFTEAKMSRLREAGYNAPFTPLEEAVRDCVTQDLMQPDPYL